MLREKPDEPVELECPECGALVRTTLRKAQEGTLHCPKGHEMDVMSVLGSGLATPSKPDR
ncbi:MAG: hypothetical protein ABTD50_12375 [Polyangiaceae bacterium]|jgi:hypothetical protein